MVTARVDKRNRSITRETRVLLAGVVLASMSWSSVAGSWKVTPSISLKETATDNVALTASGTKSDLITDLSPGIRIEGSGGRSQLSFDYQMHNLVYASESSKNSTQNALRASGSLEALENWFFIEASASIAQQSISPFGGAPSSSSNTNGNSNSAETTSYRLSPYFQGQLGDFADYRLRYGLTGTSTRSGQANDSTANELSASLKGVTSFARLRWTLNASSQESEYSRGRGNEADQLRGVLTYEINPQVRVSVIGGREWNDYASTNKEGHTTRGVGAEWAPTDRTLISATREKRFFGDSNTFKFSHRTAGTAWSYSESKDATVQTNQQSSANLGTYYDLVYNLTPTTLSPAERAALTNQLLASNNVPGNEQLPGGYLTNGATLQHRRMFSFALLGARNTVTFSASQSESESLAQTAGTGFLVGVGSSNVNRVRQRTAGVNWSHKLTPLSTLTAAYSRLNTQGTGSTSQQTRQNLLNLNLSTRLGPNTTVGLGARRVVVDGTSSYKENAVTGVLSHQF